MSEEVREVHRRRVLDPDRPKVPDVLPLAERYMTRPGNLSGGSLHVVLEEGDVDDASVASCVPYAEAMGDAEGAELARLMLRMSPTQRGKIARIAYSKAIAALRERRS